MLVDVLGWYYDGAKYYVSIGYGDASTTGAKGAPGAQGASGAKGAIGTVGNQGPKGDCRTNWKHRTTR